MEREIFDLLGRHFRGPQRPAAAADARGLVRPSAAQGLRRTAGVSRHLDRSRQPHNPAGGEEEMSSAHRRNDAEHGAAASVHPRRAALRDQGRRRGDARGDSRRRLSASLDREDRREGRLPRIHALHRPRRLRLRDVHQPGLGHGLREAGQYRSAQARRVLPGNRGRVQPHRVASALGRHDGDGYRRDTRRLPTPSASAR